MPATDVEGVSQETRLEVFRLMVLQREFEDRILMLYRQGRVPGSVYSGRGQEAVGAAAGLALRQGDVVAPLNRELACHFARGVTPAQVFRNFLGCGDSPTLGRDGNMHFGVPEKGVFPLVSMLGNLAPVVVGAALSFKRRQQRNVAMTFLGEGAFSVGDVHEALNLAGVWRVPAVFIFQSNGYSYSTPSRDQMVNTNLAERVRGGWSIATTRVDGTDALVVYEAIHAAVERAREGEGPQGVECLTLRGHGHAAHDDARYVPDELRAEFARRDPLDRLAQRLIGDGLAEQAKSIRITARDEVAAALVDAESAPSADNANVERGVYASPL